MAIIRLYKCERGYARAETEGSYRQVASFLEGDVQGSSRTCETYLGLIRQVRAGELERWEGNGNGQNIIITATSVTLEYLFLDDVIVISLDQFERVITGWSDLLTNGAESHIEL